MSCYKCGKCCCWFSVTLSEKDINREPRLLEHVLAEADIPPCKTKTFMIENGHAYVLEKAAPHAPCVFLAKGDSPICLIYETRPDVCRKAPVCTRQRTEEENAENEAREIRGPSVLP